MKQQAAYERPMRWPGSSTSSAGPRPWSACSPRCDATAGTNRPFLMEFDLVGVIAFQELNFAPPPDGLPFDPATGFTELARDFPPFEGEPYHLPADLPRLQVPVIALSGERDLRTPRSVAQQIVELAPHGVLVPLRGHGHSLLDTHHSAARRVLSLVSTDGPAAVTAARGELEALIGRSRSLTPATYVRAVMRLSPLMPRRRSLR